MGRIGREYKCKYCGKVYKQEARFEKHQKYCLKNPNRLCSTCDEKSRVPGSVKTMVKEAMKKAKIKNTDPQLKRGIIPFKLGITLVEQTGCVECMEACRLFLGAKKYNVYNHLGYIDPMLYAFKKASWVKENFKKAQKMLDFGIMCYDAGKLNALDPDINWEEYEVNIGDAIVKYSDMVGGEKYELAEEVANDYVAPADHLTGVEKLFSDVLNTTLGKYFSQMERYTFNEYQADALKTMKSASNNLLYITNGLGSEVGEVLDKIKKFVRDKGTLCEKCMYVNKCSSRNSTRDMCKDYELDLGYVVRLMNSDKEFREELKKELGDILWYIAALCDLLGISFEEVAKKNIDKLMSRLKRGKISGSGDNR